MAAVGEGVGEGAGTIHHLLITILGILHLLGTGPVMGQGITAAEKEDGDQVSGLVPRRGEQLLMRLVALLAEVIINRTIGIVSGVVRGLIEGAAVQELEAEERVLVRASGGRVGDD